MGANILITCEKKVCDYFVVVFCLCTTSNGYMKKRVDCSRLIFLGINGMPTY